jgi:hypothetical protein
MEDYAWMRQAACKGKSHLFFNDSGHGTYEAARKICAGCPVQFQCEAYGHVGVNLPIGNNRGIWGGKTCEELLDEERQHAGEILTGYCRGCDAPMYAKSEQRVGRPRTFCTHACYKSYWETHEHRTRPLE